MSYPNARLVALGLRIAKLRVEKGWTQQQLAEATGLSYVVCMGCHSHTYIETKWVGYYLPAPEDPEE